MMMMTSHDFKNKSPVTKFCIKANWTCFSLLRTLLHFMCYLVQLNALRCVTFRTSDTIQGGRSLPADLLPAEETEQKPE